MKIPKSRDDLKDDALEVAELAGRNFSDDWMENLVWVACGLIVGVLLGKFAF